MMEKPQLEANTNLLSTATKDSSAFRNGRKPKYYKPFVLQTPSLAVLLGITILLIGMVELACQRLPNTENRGLVGSLNNRTGLLDELLPRQLQESTSAARIPGEFSTSQPAIDGESSVTFTYTPGPELPRTSLTTEITRISGVDVTVEYSLYRPPFADGGASRDAWLKVGEPRTIYAPTAPKPNPDPIQTPMNPPNNINPAVPDPSVAQAPNSPKISDTNGSPAKETLPINAASPQLSAVTFIPVATSVTDVNGKVVPTFVPVAINSAGSTLSIPSGLISADATTTFLVTPSKTRTASIKASNPPNKEEDLKGTQAVVQIFTQREYILGAFIPTVLAVLFALPFGLIDAAAKEMEPIYQLSNPGGVSGSNSLGLNYVGASMFVIPFQAFRRQHWMIFITSILSPLSLFSAPLAVESIFISLKGTCNSETDSLQCFPTLSVYKTSARVLEGVLGTVAILLALLIFVAHKRKSKVLAEPISLAGMASIMHNQEYLAIVRDLPSYGVKEKQLVEMLPPAHFTIDSYQNSDGSWGYGLKISREDGAPSGNYTTANSYTNINLQNQFPNEDDLAFNAAATNSWARILRLAQVFGFLFLLLGLTTLVAYYQFVNTRNTGFGVFMSNQRFGVKFMFTSLGVVISQFWAYAREKIHRNEPYHSLTTLKASPKKTILKSPALAPITSIFTSITLLSPLLIFLDLSTILADALTITLSNVPYSSATTFEAWKVCSYMSLAILIFMIITLGMVLFRIGRLGAAEAGGEAPVTIIGKSVLLCGSSMLESFEGLSEVKGRERDKRVKGWGKLYGLGRVGGVDGIVRRGVDFREYVNVGN